MSNNKTLPLNTFIFMLNNGIKLLTEKYKYIDDLNVFPVPDGDTGTNMKITLEGASKAVSGVDFADYFLFGKTFNRGLLMNARGNSGVILSQIFKGFFKSILEKQLELNINDIAECLKSARETAYRAVITPVEGTILTVIRVVSETVVIKLPTIKSIVDMFDVICETAEKTLAKTPELLVELKEAGVVDSGGYGLCRIFEGMRLALDSSEGVKPKKPSSSNSSSKTIKINSPILSKIQTDNKIAGFVDNNDGFGYCNEFIMQIGSKVTYEQKKKEDFNQIEFKKELAKMGDSMVCVVDEDLVKLHIHSTSPWKIFEYASKFGEFLKVKVENMTQQWLEKNPGESLESLHNKNTETPFTPTSEVVKTIATVPSKNIGVIFQESLGVSVCINTAATGVPSVETFLKAFKEANTSKIILIIDDSNYFLSAKHASELLPKNVECEIYNARNIATSLYLCEVINYKESYSSIVKTLTNTIKKPIVCEISKSVKDGRFNKTKVNKGEYIGIVDKKIVQANSDLITNTKNTIKWMLGKTKCSICIIFCDENSINQKLSDELIDFIKSEYKISKPEIYIGDLENYPFTIGFIK
ncbi:MAG: DAK2 domain-containing protein [Mycoplasmoidaceae bacterium]|nr:MAG: DAK2 domain-containing protein [Mycoplasmoidaceae bacterium]